jgi:uncharacterized protein YndB with AHSA1/START domain
MADDKPIIKEIFIDARPEEIFPYLTENEKYLSWMGIAAELDPRPGGNFQVDPNGRDVILGKFLEVDPPRRLVFTWGWKELSHPVPAGSTRVEIELKPQGTGTLLRLTHSGLTGPSRERHDGGWAHYLERLKTVMSGKDPGPDPYATPSHRHG